MIEAKPVAISAYDHLKEFKENFEIFSRLTGMERTDKELVKTIDGAMAKANKNAADAYYEATRDQPTFNGRARHFKNSERIAEARTWLVSRGFPQKGNREHLLEIDKKYNL